MYYKIDPTKKDDVLKLLHTNSILYKDISINHNLVIKTDYNLSSFATFECEKLPKYKLISRLFNDDIKILDDDFMLVYGPCSVESEEQINKIAKFLKNENIKYLRGGAYKPRTSPYDFDGLKEEGIKLLIDVKKKYGFKIISELLDHSHIDIFKDVDIIQIGTRNMHNFELLKKLGKINKPIILKRGFGSTVEEWLLAAEYIVNSGNKNVILCERGIRTFENQTRNTLDLSGAILAKKLSILPVIIDPSHATGRRDLIEDLSLMVSYSILDGLLIEMHNNPDVALSDKEQALDFNQTKKLTKKIYKTREFYRSLDK